MPLSIPELQRETTKPPGKRASAQSSHEGVTSKNRALPCFYFTP